MLRGESGFYTSQLGSPRVNGHLPILGPLCHFQQQIMGGHVRKYEEVASEMGDGGKVFDGDGSDGVGTVDDVQGGGSDGAALWE